uniref:Family with sequence similarity 216 member A n=1 Tax=Myotis myotis TaxID=51298 RepID=A0A7J7S1R2_MYOMY|nr:family with sequence similarity 216 member A [Myotis myotis]
MLGQGPVSAWTDCSPSAEPPAVARTEGGGGGSAGHSYYQNSKGVLTHHRSHLSSRHSQKQHHPCTTWRHQLERGDSVPSNIAAASAPEMIIQHSLWRPMRNKGSLKTGYVSKTRCKSLKIFRKPGRLFMQSVSTNDFESYANEEIKEDFLRELIRNNNNRKNQDRPGFMIFCIRFVLLSHHLRLADTHK